ncbi:MAG TPA: HEAT repeat domain-containing protein [Pseudomonadota bacterium]|nr:HEAT repeat domain-containing protein [Pseudomonadota bacterium]
MRAALLAACLGGLSLVPLPRAAAETPHATAPVQARSCSLDDMLAGLRQALRHGSPALRRYARELLKESAIALTPEELRAAFTRERDPQVVESLGAALAARAARNQEPELIKTPLSRAVGDSDPAVRAAAVRSLRGIGSVEAMGKTRSPGYERLIRDPAPEVQQAVVDNLVSESAKVYFGHDRTVAEKAVQVATLAGDPGLAARLLREVSTEQVGHGTVQELLKLLGSGPPEVRAAAALALGGVPTGEAAVARTALLDCYQKDTEVAVRRAVIESLVRLTMGAAPPLLESLRGVAPALARELDLWQAALKTGLQEWHLLQREKQRLEQQAPK